MRELCVRVHVCLLHGKAASGKCIQFCFHRKSHYIPVKFIATSLKIGHLEHCNARDQTSEGRCEEDDSCVR